MARDTQYTLYKTGRTDPTYQNIWAFEDSAQRELWFTTKSMYPVLNNKYWRVGSTIKIPVRYEDSFDYDYVRIVNNSNNPTLRREWFCFIISRAYISNNTTLLTLAVDYVQTFYFSSSNDGGKHPFWMENGFISTATTSDEPPRGTPSEYPIPEITCMRFDYALLSYAVVIYSSVDIRDLSTVKYASAIIDGQYTAAPPYVMAANVSAISNLINDMNTKGLTDAISGIYLVPLDYLNIAEISTSPLLATDSGLYLTVNKTVPKPTSCGSYVPKNSVLLGYDYSYFTINNGQGEVSTWHYEDFDGTPTFASRVSLASGSPVIMMWPTNYISAVGADFRQLAIKINQAPACSYLNDSYKIWLAQTQNSRAAAINGAQMAIEQAKYARDNSWAYTKGHIIKGIQNAARDSVVDAGASLITGGINTAGAISEFMGGPSVTVGKGNGAGADFSNPLNVKYNYAVRESNIRDAMGAMYDMSMQYMNAQLGLETTYQYDFNVANAQHNMNAILAGYADRARVPATATGSNAYGDMCVLNQYGFMIAVYTPSAEWAEMIDKNLSASGHTVNKWGYALRKHAVYDYYSVQSIVIPANVADRPEFVRKMFIDIMSKGVYMWYVYGGDISNRIGTPYNLDNPEV